MYDNISNNNIQLQYKEEQDVWEYILKNLNEVHFVTRPPSC